MKAITRLSLFASLAVCPASLAAQSSIFSALGIGFPIEPIDVETRSLGGGVAAVERRSALNPAAAAAFDRLTITVNSAMQIRNYEFRGVDVSGLEETRFPFAIIGGRMWSLPVGFAVSFATYADRTYDLTSSDTVTPRGIPIAVSDRRRSRGAIMDIRGAAAWSPASNVSLGVGLHALVGSAQLDVQRTFDDPYYAPLTHEDREVFQGYGVSVGAMWAPVRAFWLGLSVRKDGELDMSQDGVRLASYTLPTTLSGGFIVAPGSRVRWSATGTWRSWSEIQDDLVDDRAFDTWFVGSGLEIGNLLLSRPLRIGARYQMLPFSPGDEQPRDLTLSLGTGLQFAGNSAIADFSIEHSIRQGAGMTERAWSLSAALVLRP